MDTLISDGGKYEISKRVTDLLRSLFIQDYQSEPYHQHQNKAENRFGPAKRYTNTVMNTSGCPACCWLLCLQYICVVLHHLASPTLQGICPVQALQRTTPDISFMLHSSFYEPVYYRIDSSEPDFHFPSSSNEKKGYWVGFAGNQGDCLTWRILTEDTHKIIIRSGVRSALRPTTNQRLASPSGEGTTLPFPIPYPQQSKISLPLDPLDESTPTFEHFVNSQSGEDEDNPIPMANIDIPNLLGRSFLLPPEDNGERHVAKIIDIDDHGQPLEDIKFKLKINKDQAEEIMSYNHLMDYIQKGTDAEEDPESLFMFRDIVAHQGPLESTDPNHKGSKYNVMVEWESAEVTYEPLTLISKDDPITCAVYAKKHDLLDTTGWKHLKRYAKTSKRLIRAVKQSRIRQVRASARYQHGFQVPKDYNDAIRLDKENSNTHWQDAMDLELTQIHEYKVFKDTGKAQFHNGKAVTPDGFQKIRVHFVYAVKHDGRFKARLVADGHLTKEPVESIYSGVVSLRSLRMVVFLSQLNDLEIWGADVGNAYLEAYTDEKLCIIAGPEFKELQGHLLIMIKALFRTRSGGPRWHDRLFDILQELKFKPSKADPDVWMRPEPGGTCYEYIAVYVDDLAIAAKDPQAFCNELKKKYNLKLKGVGPLEYHLGCTYKKDPDGTLAADPRRYVNKILESYERMFKEKLRKSRPPLEGGDHPDFDTSEHCYDHQTKQFQTLIGQLQWLISLGRFDIAVHVMSLSRFIKFKLKINKDQAEEIMSYNQLMDYIQKGTDTEEDPDSLFKYRDIVVHQGPLESTDPDHKGSKYNVMVEWESGEVTYEPLTLISKDDPITCAVYAKKHDLLNTTGWKHLKRYAKTSKRLIRAVKQSRIRQVRASARYQHSFQVPKDYNDAIRLDKENSNTHWQDAMDLELSQIHEYKVFKDTGKEQFHKGLVYAVKHDGRFKARLVADGHLTKEPVESIYSGVVSLRSLRMVVFLSQLNDLEIWGADVGNAYLEAYTDEKLCIIAGPEFKELQGHLLIMIKALFRTRSGGPRWHDRLFDILQELKFKPSKADPDVWMRPEPGGTGYEYIAVYVDDLAIAAKDPQAFCNELKKRYNLKLKGVGPLEYHLGCAYKKDPDGTLAADPRRYVNKILESYERMFKEKPRKSRPPLEGGDHPELDTSELCDEHQTKQFQTLIGQVQWLTSLGCFDIAVHVMSLRFRAQPRKGHLDRAKRIVGYLLFLSDGAIRFRTGEPDFSSLKDQEYDWTRSVYSGAGEQIPHDIPKPLGKHVQTTHYVDANLHHDLATGKAVTAVLHFLNQTPIDAYTNRHHLASYHRVREAIAAKYISFHWKDGKSSPADILSKHWEFATVWPMLKPILFWRGETATQLKGSDRIPSTTPGAEPPRDARDSGSARSHSTHLETSSSDRP